MNSILIADDEKIEREGIKMLLKQFDYKLDIKEAVNGKAAIEFLKTHKVDILLTDIKMPFMDGLELSEEAYRLYPDLKIIIFSGYSEFEYARKAMKLGVCDYVLKPVDPEEFDKTIKRVLEQMQTEKEEQTSKEKERGFLVEHFLLLLLNGTPQETIEARAEGHIKLDFLEQYEKMVLLEVDQNFFDSAGLDFEEGLKQELQIPFQYLNLDEQQSILLFEKNTNCDFKILAEHIFQYILQAYKRECYIAVSKPFHGMENIPKIYNKLEQLLENKFYYRDIFLFYQDQDFAASVDEEADEKLTKLITEDIQNKDIAALKNHFERLGRKYQGKTNFSQMYVKFIFSNIIKEIYLVISEVDEKNLNKEIDLLYRSNDIFNVIEITRANIERLEADLNKNEKSLRGEVETIKKYIYEHYDKDISVESLAEQVCLAPSYVSFIFKKETGQNLSKYIKAYRMERAKRMLNDSHEKIVTISQAVGYSNVSYFCQSFREYFGVSPEKYRKSGE
ncbi:MAG: response regulator [Acetivibrio sp.]